MRAGASAPVARLAHAIAKPMVWANWRGLESLLKAQLKLGKCNMVPRTRIEDGVNCSVPIATPDFYPMVADGRIKAIRGTFDRYDGKTIVMSNGERVEADIAVLAIGYKLGVPFLPEAYRDKLVEADGQYRLYRLIANPDLPDLGFVGFNSSFCTVLCADMAAHWLVRYADGKLASISRAKADARQHRDDAALQARRAPGRRRLWRPVRRSLSLQAFRRVAGRHRRHQKPRSRWLKEMFTPPDADAYGEFLASAPAYKGVRLTSDYPGRGSAR